MRLVESRRITGRHLLIPGPGVAAELAADPGETVSPALAQVVAKVESMAAATGWPVEVHARSHRSGGTLAFTFPPDLLYAGCEIIDEALADVPDPSRVRACLESEAAPRLRSLLGRASGRAVFWDDQGLTLGTGTHARTWPLDALPDDETYADHPGSAVPTVLITGTNGKTTTTRLLGRMAACAGHHVGLSSSDAIVIDGDAVEFGDWTGPAAARRVLRHASVTFAVLETARGGLMRRGLVLDGYDVAVVTNVGADHFGEWGIDDLQGMAEAKLVVGRGLRQGGTIVLNAACPPLVAAAPGLLARRPDLDVRWFGSPDADAWSDGEHIWVRDGLPAPLLPLSEVPICLRGAAPHNVENAMAAALGGRAAGIPWRFVADGLRDFRPTVTDSRGRTNLFSLRGARVIVDFAHNPDSLRRVAQFVARLQPRRTLLLLGGAGDRPDDLIEAYGLAAAELLPDITILKELPGHLRGRRQGEVPRRLGEALRRGGVPESSIVVVADEVAAARRLLDQTREGDVVVLLVHEQLDGVLIALADAGAEEG